MKKLVLIIAAVLSASAYACPDLSGTYLDKNGESVVLGQHGCTDMSILSRPLTTTLLLDNNFTVVQDDNDVTANGRGAFDATDVLVIEVKVTYKKDPGIPKFLLPVRGVNKYTLTTTGDLQELGTIYNFYDKVLTTTKTIYKRSTY